MPVITAKAEARFWPKVAVQSEDKCWEWLAAKHGHGYGMFYTGRNIKRGQMEFAHRVSYELANGQFDYSLCVMHTCDNMSCVNPSHLRLGTQLDNIQDRENKNRNKPKLKLTLEQVIQIKNAPKYVKTAWLASTYCVNASQVSRVRRGLVPYWEKLLNEKE